MVKFDELVLCWARTGANVVSLPGIEWTLYSVRLRISLGVLEIRKTATGIIHSLCNSPPSLVELQQGLALIGGEVQSVATPAI